MTPLQAILSFTLASSLLTLTPGIDTALVLRTATAKGRREAMAVAFGTAAGCILWCTLVALGLGALLLVSKTLYDVLRLAGACYLLYLGARMLWNAGAHELMSPNPDLRKNGTGWGWFAQGFFNNLLNPKVGVFYVTFLPQFIPPGENVAAFRLLLGSIHAIEGLIWFSLLTLATCFFSGWLKQPQVVRRLDQVTGGILVAFGLRLALEPRHIR